MLLVKKLTKSCDIVIETHSIMNLEQLIITWKGQQLVLTLFASNSKILFLIMIQVYFQNNGQLLANELKR